MGAQLSILAQSSPSIGIFSYIDVLEDVHYISLLNSSRFLKTCKALDTTGEIIIKVFIKPTDDYSLEYTLDAIRKESLSLSQLPNVLNYSKMIESNRAGYLIRQHLRRNLYDRLSSRPYLQEIESKFTAFQLLQTLKDIHNLDIVHTDIKTENIMVNSWNWIALSDFAAHIKPVYLPEDNPSEFSFYFDTSKRRNCYIAPERFNTKLYNDTTRQHKPTKEMDIFSAGCCIAELFSEGIPIFNLSQLFKYKANEHNVTEYFNEHFKDDTGLKNLIMDMIDLDPSKRLSAKEILEKYRDKFFPSYFYNFTYDYFRSLASLITSIPSSGSLTEFCNLEDKQSILDDSLLKVYGDFTTICTSLGFPISNNIKAELLKQKTRTNFFFSKYIKLGPNSFVVLNNFERYQDIQSIREECALLFISYLSRLLRNLHSNNNKIKCLELLTAFSQYVSDNNKIDRVIPYLETSFEEDGNPVIQALSVQCLCQVLSTVENINQLNEYIFVDYLLPRLKKLLKRCKEQPYVRMIFANTIGNFVNLASKFRELSLMSHFNSNKLENDEDILINHRYAKKLVQQIEEIIIILLTDTNVWVRISLLNNVLCLCKFLGKEKTNDIILSHLITYLNDKNAILRMSLVEAISGIAILLGPITLEQYILPLLIQTLTDAEELVVSATIETLRNLCKTGLTNEKNTFDIAREISPLLLHPNYSIRQFSIITLFEISQKLSKPDLYCNLYPIIRPYFGFEVEFTLDLMLDSCKQPVSRTIYNLLCSWSLRASSSLFWKQVPTKNVDSFGNTHINFISKDYIPKTYGLGKNVSHDGRYVSETANIFVKSFDDTEVPLTTEDKLWIDKFKTLGMKDQNLWKLLILRNYVLRLTKITTHKSKLNLQSSNENLDKIYSSINLVNAMPHNVFFDIEFVNEAEGKGLDSQCIQSSHTIYDQKNSTTAVNTVPEVIDMHGSLIFKAKPMATTTSNLRNVYVQLEPNNLHDQIHKSFSQKEQNNKAPEYVLSNSYEGDVGTILKYLRSIDISPSLRDYKEFGPITNATKENEKLLTNLVGNIKCSLTKNIRDLIASICTSSNSSYIVSGSLQGIITVYSANSIVIGEICEPEVSFDCNSTITDVIMLQGFDTFAVSTTDGHIKLFRILSYDQLNNSRLSTYIKEVRSINFNKEVNISLSVTDKDKDEHIVKMKEFLTEDKALLFCLTNCSRIMYIDIRKMDHFNYIDNPASHGGITTFCLSQDNHTLIMGTTKGIIDIWDLRLNILVNSWTFDDSCIIKDIQLVPKVGKNMILIVGGSSEGIISIWNYSKIQCRLVISISGHQPSVDKFQPIFKKLDELKYQEDKLIQRISTLHVQGSVILFSDYVTNDMVMINLLQVPRSKVLFGPNKSNYTFTSKQITTNVSVVLMQKKENKKSDTNTRIEIDTTNNMINTITTLNSKGKALLITGDNLGVINVYE